MDLKECLNALERLSTFVSQNDRVVNVCMVDFITKDIFASAFKPNLQKELLQLNQEQLCDLPQMLFKKLELVRNLILTINLTEKLILTFCQQKGGIRIVQVIK